MSQPREDGSLGLSYLRNCGVLLPSQTNNVDIEVYSARGYLKISSSSRCELLSFCLSFSGFVSTSDLIETHESTGLDASDLWEVVNLLVSAKVFVHAHQLFEVAHAAGVNPQAHSSQLSRSDVAQLTKSRASRINLTARTELPSSSLQTLLGRHSCRSFDSGDCSSFHLVKHVVAAALSPQLSASPSAGNLRPISCTLLRRLTSGWELWAYFEDSENFYLSSKFHLSELEPDLSHALDSVDCLFGSEVILIFSADLLLTSKKYGNRGYRYALLECGQTVQNVLTACTELGLATIEWGAFRDQAIADLLEISTSPIIVVGVGKKGTFTSNGEQLRNTYETLANWQENNTKLVRVTGRKEPSLRGLPLHLSFFQCSFSDGTSSAAPYSNVESDRLSTGIARTTHEAAVRAIAEAVERLSSQRVRVDFVGTSSALPAANTISPDELTCHELKSYLTGRLGYEPFSPNLVYEWALGATLSGQSLYLPIEFVFYPVSSTSLGRAVCTLATSNGVAAGASYTDCRIGSTSELIERDAYVRSWRSGTPPTRWVGTSWFQAAQSIWRQRGVDIVALCFDAAVPTVGVALIGGGFPALAFGMSCKMSWDAALLKAYEEACGGFLSADTSDPSEEIPLRSEIRRPLDHAKFYWSASNFSEVSWFFAGDYAEPSVLAPEVYSAELEKVMEETYFFELDSNGLPLICIRAVNPKLEQIWFGHCDDSTPHFFP